MVAGSDRPGTGRGWLDRPIGLVIVSAVALPLMVIFPVGPLAGTGLLALAGAKSRLVQTRLVATGAPRWAILFSGGSLAAASYTVLAVVIPGRPSDNAWLAVTLPGMWLGAIAAGALVVAILPGGMRELFVGALLLNLVVYGGALVAALGVGAIVANERDLTGLDFRGPVRLAFVVFAAAWSANIALHVLLARRACVSRIPSSGVCR